jgi:hypothetical protein
MKMRCHASWRTSWPSAQGRALCFGAQARHEGQGPFFSSEMGGFESFRKNGVKKYPKLLGSSH